MNPIILASTSPYRKQLLDNIGIPYKAVSPKFNEDSVKSESYPPQALCEILALKKAQSLTVDFPNCYIIGSDQLINFEGEILGKAGSFDLAVKQILKLQGSTHSLITSLAVLYQNKIKAKTIVTELTMRSIDYEQAIAFVERDKAWDCAGSYKLEKSGILLFSKIETDDSSAIIGLPIIALTEILLEYGVPLPLFKPPSI